MHAPTQTAHERTDSPPVGCQRARSEEREVLVAAPPASLYKIGLSLVAVTMLILPLIYLALTAAAGWGAYYFALHCVPAIWNWHIGFTKLALAIKFVCLVTPLVAGSSIAFFMVKPLLARQTRRAPSAVLDPEAEPRVTSLVNDICRLVGAPQPVRIELDCDVNASAGFDGGWGGFVSNRLILRLGLPLVAGLTQRELAGVIAHEFGHFRQGPAFG